MGLITAASGVVKRATSKLTFGAACFLCAVAANGLRLASMTLSPASCGGIMTGEAVTKVSWTDFYRPC